MSIKEFNPNRLTIARELMGYTQTALASKLGITARSVRGYEKGDYDPEDTLLLAKILNVPEDFFFGDDIELLDNNQISFRAASKMTLMIRNQAKTYASFAFSFNHWLENEFTLPEPNIPDLSSLSPEDAAIELRNQWGLSDAPIDNIIALLELNGVRVFALNLPTFDIDACCAWDKNTPFIFTNNNKSAERIRFDMAHELGHLVRDQHLMSGDNTQKDHRTIEKEANEFASAFLMPKSSLKTTIPNFVTVDTLIKLKKKWKVSVAALAYRINQLELISEWVYSRVLSPEMSKRGFRTNEPNKIEKETSKLLQTVAQQLKEDCIGLDYIANKINIPRNALENLVFNSFFLTKMEVIKGSEIISPSNKKPSLSIVK